MNRYYYTARVFHGNQTSVKIIAGTLSSYGDFDLVKVISDVASKYEISPNDVLITFFTKISEEAYMNYDKLIKSNKS